MDILHLVDRLEELFNESRPIPLTHNVIIDEDKILDIIDQMRVTIPDEMKKAQQVLSQRDRILAQAQEEANRTLKLAREKSEKLIERDPIIQAAHAQADDIITQALGEVEKTRRDEGSGEKIIAPGSFLLSGQMKEHPTGRQRQKRVRHVGHDVFCVAAEARKRQYRQRRKRAAPDTTQPLAYSIGDQHRQNPKECDWRYCIADFRSQQRVTRAQQ